MVNHSGGGISVELMQILWEAQIGTGEWEVQCHESELLLGTRCVEAPFLWVPKTHH